MDVPENQQVYRHWIELRDLRDGSLRVLRLQAFKLIHLSTRKGAPQLPDKVVLRVQDGAEVFEGRDIDDLAGQLRLRFPDETFERFLRSERDREAEERKAEALDRLIDLLAEAVLEGLRREEAGWVKRSPAAA